MTLEETIIVIAWISGIILWATTLGEEDRNTISGYYQDIKSLGVPFLTFLFAFLFFLIIATWPIWKFIDVIKNVKNLFRKDEKNV